MRRSVIAVVRALSRLAPLALLASSACAREPAPVVHAPVAVAPEAGQAASATPSPPPPVLDAGARQRPGEPPAACADALPPEDMVTGNIATTSMSALAEIVASAKTGPNGTGPAPTTGYVNFRYEVQVTQWLEGTGPERLVLLQMAEADFDPKPPGTLLLFSACNSNAGYAYEPDVGYFFPIDPACRAEAESLGADAAKRARRSGKRARGAGAACKR